MAMPRQRSATASNSNVDFACLSMNRGSSQAAPVAALCAAIRQYYDRFIDSRNSALVLVRSRRLRSSSIASTTFMSASTLRSR